MLEKYQLNEFVPLVEGIQKGDLRMFNDALVDYQDQFVRYVAYVAACALCFSLAYSRVSFCIHSRGTYLLLEKCKMVRRAYVVIPTMYSKYPPNLSCFILDTGLLSQSIQTRLPHNGKASNSTRSSRSNLQVVGNAN